MNAWDSRTIAVVAAVALGSPILGGCDGARPPAAASNEVFASDDPITGIDAPMEDRWASIVLDASQNAEVRAILGEAAAGADGITPLGPAPHGVRFEDVPRAMLNTAPKVEMAILRSQHVESEVVIGIEDVAGRSATVTVRFTTRGPLASLDYRVPGTDADAERARLLAMVDRRLRAAPIGAAPEVILDDLVRTLDDGGVIVGSRAVQPESWRYTLLMLDEEEASIEIRRVPPPRIVEWTATAGTFPRPEVARRLGETFMDFLRAWGREARWNGTMSVQAPRDR